MKMKCIHGWNGMVAAVLVAVAASAAPAEDVVQERFRRAMVAEEADQDLTAAVRGYESVLEGAETPLRLAATALYRLGECHRKLGRTNEATAAFERLAREFAGQTNLVRLARQNLAALGWREPVAERAAVGTAAPVNPAVQKAQADLAEAARIEGILEMAKKSEGMSSSDILEAGLPSAELAQLRQQIRDLSLQLQRARREGSTPDDKEARRLERQLMDLQEAHAEGLKRLHEQKRVEVEVLRRGARAQLAALGVAAPNGAGTRDPEDVEIERLQSLEKEAPDLLRRGAANAASPIEDAVAKGRMRVVEYLLGKGIPVSGPGAPSGLLVQAVQNGRLNMVDLLLRRGADVNAGMPPGSPPLHTAIVLRFPAIIQRLLEAKPDLEAVSNPMAGLSASTPLGLAVQVRDPDLVKKLLASGAKPKGLLRLAVQSGDASIPRLLIQGGLDPKTDPEAYEALVAAVACPDPKAMLRLLAESGVDFNQVRGAQPSALHHAIAAKRSLELVPILLELGADPNRVSAGRTPLGVALQGAKTEVVRLLLDKGADPGLRTLAESSPVAIRAYLASRNAQSLDILRMVLEKGGKVDEYAQQPVSDFPALRDRTGFRALELATAFGDLEAVQWLLAHGASPTLRNPTGWTVLQWMKEERLEHFNPDTLESGRAAVRKALIEAGTPDPSDPRAGGRVFVYRKLMSQGLESVGPVEWKRGETLWLSALVAGQFPGQRASLDAVEVVRGSAPNAAVLRVDLRGVTKPGDTGDLELLDLDRVQVPERRPAVRF